MMFGLALTILAATVVAGLLLVLIIVVLNKLTKRVLKKLIKNRTELEDAHHAIVVESKHRQKAEIPFAEFAGKMDEFDSKETIETATLDIYDSKNNRIGQMKVTGRPAKKRPIKQGTKIRV